MVSVQLYVNFGVISTNVIRKRKYDEKRGRVEPSGIPTVKKEETIKIV